MNFFWSHTLLNALGLGYGRLYNWFCTQPQARPVYGYLYNWYAATDSRNICSAGSHVASLVEYQTLADYLGASGNYGTNTIGGKLREIGLTYWVDPNTGATNEVEFNGRGGGRRLEYGIFVSFKQNMDMWTSTDAYYNYAYGTEMNSAANALLCTTGTFLNKSEGRSIRLIKDSTTLTHGQTGTYTDPSGIVYPTICIGTQEWVSCDIMTKHYRNGDPIPEVTDNTAWSALTTGARCSYYNVEANAGTTASIAPVGWHVPTYSEYYGLLSALGVSDDYAGSYIKEIGTVHWATESAGTTNSSGFTAVGAGRRNESGVFEWLKTFASFLLSTLNGTDTVFIPVLHDVSSSFYLSSDSLNKGYSIRLIKDDSTWTIGDTLTIDGYDYKTVKIGTQVWTAENLRTDKLNDGTPIPLIEDNAAWANATSMAQCIYENNPENI